MISKITLSQTLGRIAVAGAMAVASLGATPALAQVRTTENKPQDFSLAERLLFMSDHLRREKPSTTLHYTMSRKGTAEPAVDTGIDLKLGTAEGGGCCSAQVLVANPVVGHSLPAVEKAEGNPVLLYFLDRDVREMHRITKGSENYYRKRIRMAIYQGARVIDVKLPYQGREVNGKRVEIAPYDDDPARSRYEKYARKRYQFDLSDEVPGGVHGILTVMRDADDAKPPMIVEELRIDGAGSTAMRP